jgi:excisionase family DNA binding protein
MDEKDREKQDKELNKEEDKKEEKWVLTPKEASRLLGLGRGLTYEAIRRGDIPSLRIGGRILIPLKLLKRQIEGGEFKKVDESGL